MKKTWLSLCLLLLTLLGVAQIEKVIPPAPNPPRLVVDLTNTLSPDQQQALEAKLVAYDDSTSNQIAVVLIPTTGDYEISEVAYQLGRKWGVGNKENNNGVVLLVAKNDRKVFIAPGYGLEGAIPDAIAKRIVEVLDSYKIKPRVAMLVTDNASAMAKARALVVASEGLQHVIPFR